MTQSIHNKLTYIALNFNAFLNFFLNILQNHIFQQKQTFLFKLSIKYVAVCENYRVFVNYNLNKFHETQTYCPLMRHLLRSLWSLRKALQKQLLWFPVLQLPEFPPLWFPLQLLFPL